MGDVERKPASLCGVQMTDAQRSLVEEAGGGQNSEKEVTFVI